MTLGREFDDQSFPNGYALVDGVAMHAKHGANFQIPHPVLKKHLDAGHFVELRIDSDRFSMHDDDAQQCACPSCNGQMSKPILSHEHPASLLPLPAQDIPSRGWGEDFWVRLTAREDQWLSGVVDNPLYETRLHEIKSGNRLVFHTNHVLAVHGSHRAELVARMDAADLKTLAEWLG